MYLKSDAVLKEILHKAQLFADCSIEYLTRSTPKPIDAQVSLVGTLRRLTVDLDYTSLVACQATRLKFPDVAADYEAINALIAWAQVQLEVGLEHADNSKRRKQKVWEVFSHLNTKVLKHCRSKAGGLETENARLKQEIAQFTTHIEELYEAVQKTEANTEGFSRRIKQMNEVLEAKELIIRQLRARSKSPQPSLGKIQENSAADEDDAREGSRRRRAGGKSTQSTRSSLTSLGDLTGQREVSCQTRDMELERTKQAKQALEHELLIARQAELHAQGVIKRLQLTLEEAGIHETEEIVPRKKGVRFERMETKENRVASLFESSPVSSISIEEDYQGHSQQAVGRLTEQGRNESQASLEGAYRGPNGSRDCGCVARDKAEGGALLAAKLSEANSRVKGEIAELRRQLADNASQILKLKTELRHKQEQLQHWTTVEEDWRRKQLQHSQALKSLQLSFSGKESELHGTKQQLRELQGSVDKMTKELEEVQGLLKREQDASSQAAAVVRYMEDQVKYKEQALGHLNLLNARLKTKNEEMYRRLQDSRANKSLDTSSHSIDLCCLYTGVERD
jgi:chromosome segregation ATPase